MMNKIAEIVTNWENAKGIIRVGVRKPAEENTNDLFLGEYMGMETFFYIPVEVNGQRGNVKVTYPMFENYGVTSSEMLAVAINNNAKAGFTIRSMAEVMAELMGVDDAPESEAPLYIVTNNNLYYGAAAILDHNILDKGLDTLRTDRIMVIPSSVHELIIVDANNEIDEMNQIIISINTENVLPEDQLADHYFTYDRENGLR